MSKKNILIICLLVIVTVFAVLFINRMNKKTDEKNTNTYNEKSEKIEYDIDINKSKKDLENSLDKIEEDYEKEKSTYDRTGFYFMKLSQNYDTYIEIVDKGDINFNSEKYNSKLEKIEELPELKYNGKLVELGSKYDLNERSYYLIRYQDERNGKYMLYFIGSLSEKGFQNLKLYCITTGEYVDQGTIAE